MAPVPSRPFTDTTWGSSGSSTFTTATSASPTDSSDGTTTTATITTRESPRFESGRGDQGRRRDGVVDVESGGTKGGTGEATEAQEDDGLVQQL